MTMTRRAFTTHMGLLAMSSTVLAALSVTAAPDKAHGSPSPEVLWQALMAGNKRFIAGKARPREVVQKRAKLATGQQPHVIVLGCADSRLSPELIFDQNLGDLFVVRTAGNIADPVALGSIEYAAEHLHSSLFVILGHEKCGAVIAAASGEKMPSPNLQAIVDKIHPAVGRVQGKGTGDALIQHAVEANVQQSADDILAHSPILHKAVNDKHLTIIKAVYHLKNGAVTRL
jgi:carbonic anhydrase